MTLPSTAICPQCGKTAWLKDTPWGDKQYSHKADEGYHNAKIKDVFPNETIDVASYDAPAPKSTVRREKVEQPDWDAISRGKVRHGVAVAYIRSGAKQITPDVVAEMEAWTDYIMTGRLENNLAKEREAESVELPDDIPF